MCVFPAMIFLVAHGHNDKLSLAEVIFLWLLILCGVWAILSSLFRLDADGALSWIVGAIMAFGFAAFAFLVAWTVTEGWSGGIPFIPAAWNQVVARSLFAFGGLLALVSVVVFLRKALKRYRKDDDDVA